LSSLRLQVEETVKFLQNKTSIQPQVGIILGTGLGALVNEMEVAVEISYKDIPNFPISTVEFHAGKLLFGRISEKPVVVMQGRFHYYEGFSMKQITFPVRVMKQLGVETLLISNACGGINPDFRPGDLMLITDHINLFGDNPLIGENDDYFGPRFPDMSEPYSRRLIHVAEKIAVKEKIELRKGVYAAMTGPSLETAAEYRFLRTIGADTVGMSTIPETIVAVHSSIEVLGISVITDACVPEELKPVNIKEIIQIAKNAEPKLTTIMKKVIEKL